MFFFNNLWPGTVPVTSVIQLHMEEIKCDHLHFQNKCAAIPGAPVQGSGFCCYSVNEQSGTYFLLEWKKASDLEILRVTCTSEVDNGGSQIIFF